MTSSEDGSFTVIPNSLIRDGKLTITEKAVLFSLLSYVNAETRRAWPSTVTLAKDTGLSQKCVIYTLRQLEKSGLIRSEKKAGCVTRYEVLTTERRSALNDVQHLPSFSGPLNDVQYTTENSSVVPLNDVQPINNNIQTLITSTNTNTKNAPAKISKKKTADFDADFEEFWQAYPKPKNPDKSPGRQKYTALRKKGVSADDLLKAAQNYARAMRGTDPRYIKHSATFLGPSDAWRDYLNAPETARSDELPDAAQMFPNLAEWMRRQGGEQVG